MKENKKITIQLITPFSFIIFILFFVAKIFDKIDWSWWWVFSPLWIPLFIVTSIVLITWILYIIILIIEKIWKL